MHLKTNNNVNRNVWIVLRGYTNGNHTLSRLPQKNVTMAQSRFCLLLVGRSHIQFLIIKINCGGVKTIKGGRSVIKVDEENARSVAL